MPVIYQTTIEKEASLKGSSLHTGGTVTLTLKPAEANSGYTFKRIDLPDAPTINVAVENVKQVERATTISEGAVKIHTIEHLTSALRGLGIDNALIEMDSNEPPIGDGSSDLFVQLIDKAGKKELTIPRTYFELKEPVYVYGKDDSYMVALPHDSFKVTCTNANHTGYFTQFFSVEVNPETYRSEISKARTFVFYEEVQPLLEKGLIKGGSLENAIVIRGESILSKDPLRYREEFVRHKILDVIGDLSLFPIHLKAHIIAAKPSHALNVELAKAIAKEYKRYLNQLMPIEYIPVGEGALDIQEVMNILPHRYPFLMVDRILKFEGDSRATGCKNVSINEPFFQGHFPGHPLMPGVLQLEAMAQVASLLLLRRADNVGRIGFFMSADKVKFRKPVVPGDTLIIQVELVKMRGKIGKAVGQCTVNGELVSEGELSFVVQ
ncbi:MAG: bifunctional UDP-3-O-[3-hydroxymyristoyl] N-acetylglucosamine deacetylase/3-hydroxyacyl-ACP dehydratase [Methylacidiphilales bacterium]|nr:bifunctional UDP-3-O-[3-hydroxymyristoyl] N-acetylglucosamine deacetylase/3-hydroxyacyl-ACP dehydratase [Candidatus Methylacidiphilales bacterium]